MKEFRLTKAQKIKLNNTKERKAERIVEEASQIRQAHIKRCKEHAIKALETGKPETVLTSFVHNMKSKLETNMHPALFLIPELSRQGQLNTCTQVLKFIEGFN